jgi:hypothetical protein
MTHALSLTLAGLKIVRYCLLSHSCSLGTVRPDCLCARLSKPLRLITSTVQWCLWVKSIHGKNYARINSNKWQLVSIPWRDLILKTMVQTRGTSEHWLNCRLLSRGENVLILGWHRQWQNHTGEYIAQASHR